jgi:lysophospholipase L1-like esterase
MTQLTFKRKILFVVLAILPVIGILVAVELHLRAESAKWYQKKLAKNHALNNSLRIHRKSDDPQLVYELTPGAELDRQGIHYKINQAGFRDDEFPPSAAPKKPGEYRIVVIGDSVAWGWGVDMTQAWPQLLEQQLDEQFKDQHVVVYNLAVNGYATPQEARILEKYGLAYHPDLVILNYVLNDPEVEDGGLSWYFESINRIETIYQGKLLFSFVYNGIKAQLGLIQPPNDTARDHFFLTHHSDLFENVETGFQKISRLAESAHTQVLVIVTPVFQFRKEAPYPWKEIHLQIETLSHQNHFMFLDTQPAFADEDSDAVSLDPIHPNAKGHAIIAQHVLEKITGDKIIR